MNNTDINLTFNKLVVFVVFITGCMLSFNAYPATSYIAKTTKFTARVSNIRLNSIFIKQGKKPNDEVSVNARSIIFKKQLNIKDVRTWKESSVPEINRYVAYTKALISGNPKFILSFWNPKERKNKEKMLSNPKVIKSMRNYFKTHPGLIIIGVIYQAKTSAVLTNTGHGAVALSFIKINKKYYLTDRPSNDLALAIIEAAYWHKIKGR